MELFVKIDKILESRTGMRQDGSQWTSTPIVFEEPVGDFPQSIMLEVFEEPAKLGMQLGKVGYVRFTSQVYLAKNGGLYNRLQFRNWREYQNEPQPQPTAEPETYDQPPL